MVRASLRAAEREREGELATTSLELEYLQYLEYRKSRCEMLIDGDDISNDFSSIFHVFFNVFFLHLHSFPLRAYWRKSDSSVDSEPQKNWR